MLTSSYSQHNQSAYIPTLWYQTIRHICSLRVDQKVLFVNYALVRSGRRKDICSENKALISSAIIAQICALFSHMPYMQISRIILSFSYNVLASPVTFKSCFFYVFPFYSATCIYSNGTHYNHHNKQSCNMVSNLIVSLGENFPYF